MRIAHHPQLRVLGVGCQRTQPYRVGEYPLESCSFKVIDDVTFERELSSSHASQYTKLPPLIELHHFPCDTDEEVTVVENINLSLDKNDGGSRTTYIVVGTQYYQSGETEASAGRLLLFEARCPWLPKPKENRQDLKDRRGDVGLATSLKVKGCVFAVAEISGLLAAAINESVSSAF